MMMSPYVPPIRNIDNWAVEHTHHLGRRASDYRQYVLNNSDALQHANTVSLAARVPSGMTLVAPVPTTMAIYRPDLVSVKRVLAPQLVLPPHKQ
jgi:hypothetical protein